MAKILYVAANPKEEENSFCLSVARKFIEKYKQKNPSDTIEEVNVYYDDFPVVDRDVVNGWEKLWTHQPLSNLSDDEKQKIFSIDDFADEFSFYDKYIIANPMWNFTIPPRLKAFIDSVVIADKTFKFTKEGPEGLLKNKKLFHIQASGGVYKNTPREFSDSYIRAIFAFMGVSDVQSVFIEGVNMYPDKANEIKEQAVQEAEKLALEF